MTAREAGAKAVHWGVIVFFAGFAAFPFLWMLITSFKGPGECSLSV